MKIKRDIVMKLSFTMLAFFTQIAPAASVIADIENLSEASVRRKWRLFEKSGDQASPKNAYPYQDCFERTGRLYGLPVPLLLAVARGESDFNRLAKSHKQCYGVMQIQWPDTAIHLGINRREALFDACINIDAGGRYLAELLERFEGDIFLALAAYNYGPGRIERALASGVLPQGAVWYAAYIYNHLNYIYTQKTPRTGRVLVFAYGRYSIALANQRHFEHLTKDVIFDIFKSQDHFAFNLCIICNPERCREAVARFQAGTGSFPTGSCRYEGGQG